MVSIWANNEGRACDGPAVAAVELETASVWNKYKPKNGFKLTGFAVDDDGGQGRKVIQFPAVVGYKGGLYYQYFKSSLVYAKVSERGRGPDVIYGFRQLGTRPGMWAFLDVW